jgi:hypothetical protein
LDVVVAPAPITSDGAAIAFEKMVVSNFALAGRTDN